MNIRQIIKRLQELQLQVGWQTKTRTHYYGEDRETLVLSIEKDEDDKEYILIH